MGKLKSPIAPLQHMHDHVLSHGRKRGDFLGDLSSPKNKAIGNCSVQSTSTVGRYFLELGIKDSSQCDGC